MKEHTYPLKMDHIAAGVCYYPEHWGETYWKKDLQLMKELGLETARVGEFAWNFFEPREGVYDFALFDRFLDEAKEAGVKIIFCTPTCTPPAWLSRRYPETLNTTIEGNPYRHGMRQHHNMTSPVYLEKCDRLIEAMASHFRQSSGHHRLAAGQRDQLRDFYLLFSGRSRGIPGISPAEIPVN